MQVVNEKDYTQIPSRETIVAKEYHYYITGTVGGYNNHELLNALREAGPYDSIYIHINTQGGDLDYTIELVHAIQASQATVVGVAEGAVVSAGSIIFFSCHGFLINPMAYFMIHDGSTGYFGKINENHKAMEFSKKHFNKIYHEVYGKFFTEDEINEVLGGKDIYLLAEEVEARVQKVLEEEKEKDGVVSGEGQITDGAGI